MTLTTSDQAYRKIHHMLARGELCPGQRVSQSQLARQMGCSTVPIVEAMRRLESEGILVKQPRKMARVRKLSSLDIEGLYLLREGLEAVTARLCANRITDQESNELVDLREVYEAAWEQGRPSETECDADIAIHRHIAKCAHAPLLSSEFDRLTLFEQTVGRGICAGKQGDGEQLGNPHDHRAIIQALLDHDADSAEYLMRKHIQNGYREAVARLERESEDE